MGTEYVIANKSRGSKDIKSSLRKLIGEMNRQGFRVTILRTDNESGIVSTIDSVITCKYTATTPTTV